ncbi:MAG: acyltransferase [Bacteroidetes bacterium]|nr:acyltransferase [Bacteroidota bacterium]
MRRHSIIEKIGNYRKALYYRLWVFVNKRRFKNFGRQSYIKAPLSINGFENISIGNNVCIGFKSWIAAVPLTNANECLLQIGDGCIIGNLNHIYATQKIIFGNKVLTADKVFISDNIHGYADINVAIMDQPIQQKREVIIGDGSWIGENVCIIGATIGKNCVIGANAVVTKDIDDYSVVAGNPAKIIKRYCADSKTWKRTTPDGKFI